MQTKATKATRQSARKAAPRKKKSTALATCPVNGAGWCSFPFSASQLQKRLRTKSEQEPQETKQLSTAGSSRSSKTR